MKVAKASKAEWEKVLAFVQELEEQIKYAALSDSKSDEELGKWIRESSPPFFRIVFGYQVLVDNCCDPAADTLEFKPEIKRAIENHEPLLAALKSANDVIEDFIGVRDGTAPFTMDSVEHKARTAMLVTLKAQLKAEGIPLP